jgi:hypothetical protein
MGERDHDFVRKAAEALSNLNIFAAIETILEGGHVMGGATNGGIAAKAKIIAICKAERRRQIRIFDLAKQSAERRAEMDRQDG